VAYRCAPRCIPNHDDPTFQTAKADDSLFTVVLARVFNLNGDAFEYAHGVSDVETASTDMPGTKRTLLVRLFGLG